jgi:hypothetical protein
MTHQRWRNVRHGGQVAAVSQPHHGHGVGQPSRQWRTGLTNEQEYSPVHGVFEHALRRAVRVGLEGVRVTEHGVEQVPWLMWCGGVAEGVGSLAACKLTWGPSPESECSVARRAEGDLIVWPRLPRWPSQGKEHKV